MTALLVAILLGQGFITQPKPGSGNFAAVPNAMTTAAMTLYVSTTGNDSNACTATGAGACLTIQGAVNKVPKRIRHAVNISVATGSYSVGAYVEGFTFECGAGTTSAGCYLKINGTLINSTIASGLVTGTVASATAGSSTLGTAASKSIVTVTGAGWTVSDLRNRFLVVTTAGGVVQTRPIYDNTATTITVESIWATTPANPNTFAIMDAGSIITGGLTLPASQARTDLTGTIASTAISNYASFIVSANTGNSSPTVVPDTGGLNTSDTAVMIERFGFSGVTHALSVRHSGMTLFYLHQITGALTTAVGSAISVLDAGLRVYGVVVSTAMAANVPLVGTYAFNAGGTVLSIRACVLTGGAIIGSEGAINPCAATSTQMSFAENNIRAGTATNGLLTLCTGGGAGQTGLQGELYEANTTGPCVSFKSGSANSMASWGQVNIIGGEFDNCTGDAIKLGGVSMSNSATVTSGTGSTGYGWHLLEGVNAHIYTSSTVTGTAGNISLDGLTAITYAQLATNLSLRRLSQNVGGMNNTAELPAGVSLLDLIPTASLPAASVANTAGLAYDTTLAMPSWSNGTVWRPFRATSVYSATIFDPANLVANMDFADSIITDASTLKAISFTSQTAGTISGGTTATFSLCNGAGACALSFGNVVVNCTAATGTITAGTVTTAAIPAGTDANWRMTADGCTLNPLGVATATITNP